MVEDALLYFLAFSLSVKVLLSLTASTRRPRSALYAGTVSRLVIYPVKSMRGVDVNTAECTQRGLKSFSDNVFDRNFMVISSDGVFVSGRAYPKLTTIRVTIGRGCIVLSVDGAEDLTLRCQTDSSQPTVDAEVWEEPVQGQDCGEEAARWISTVLNKPGMRMVYGADGLQQRQIDKRDTTWVQGSKDGDNVTFADGYPILLLSEASVKDLDKRVQTTDVIMDQFRPNIVVSGCPPYDEDNWNDVWVGEVKFCNLKPCTRCTFTTIDPRVGKRNKNMEPLQTLRKYRMLVPEFAQLNSPCLGVNLVTDTPNGTINVGDPIYVLRK